MSQTVQVGYAPEDLLPPLTQEPDFEEFWDESLEQLRQIDPQYQLIHQPELSRGEINVYEVRLRSYGNVRVGGWYEVPKTRGPHPVILRFPGYGASMKPIDRFNDMIVLSFNPRGHGNSQDDVKGKPVNYWIRGLDDKQGYYYHGAYLDCVRAVDFMLKTRGRSKTYRSKGRESGRWFMFLYSGIRFSSHFVRHIFHFLQVGISYLNLTMARDGPMD